MIHNSIMLYNQFFPVKHLEIWEYKQSLIIYQKLFNKYFGESIMDKALYQQCEGYKNN